MIIGTLTTYLKTHYNNFRDIRQINVGVRSLARQERTISVKDTKGKKVELSPSYFSWTGRTLYRADRFNDLDISQLLLELNDLLHIDDIKSKNQDESGILLFSSKKKAANFLSMIIHERETIDKIKHAVKSLKKQGIFIPFFKPFIGSLGLRLYRAGFLLEARELNHILQEILDALDAYADKKEEISTGTLDWLKFWETYRFLSRTNKEILGNKEEILLKNQTSELVMPRTRLEIAQIIDAVNGNIYKARNQRQKEEIELLKPLIEELKGEVSNVREMELKVVRTIKKLLPGGAPTLLYFTEIKDKPCLISEAVALDDLIIAAGSKLLNMKLGEIYNYLPPDINVNQNITDGEKLLAIPKPHDRAFLRGEVKVDYIDYEEYTRVCANFIGKGKLNRMERALMAWISWPKGSPNGLNPILWVPLIYADLKTGRSRKMGLIAVVAKAINEQDIEKIKLLADAAAIMLHRREIQEKTAAYFDGKVQTAIREGKLKNSVINDATVGFFDISGFTALCDKLNELPDKVFDLINLIYDKLVPIVIRRKGRIDKYIGDCLMADWGVPWRESGDVESAVNTVINIQRELQRINSSAELQEIYLENNISPLGLTVGLNTGKLFAGNIGTKFKVDYSVLGGTVNAANRLQHAARRGQVLIGVRTFDLLSEEFKKNCVDEFNAYNRNKDWIKRFVENEYKKEGIISEKSGDELFPSESLNDKDLLDFRLADYIEKFYQDARIEDVFIPSVIYAKGLGAVCCYYLRWDRQAWRYRYLEEAGITLKSKSRFENQPPSVLETWKSIFRESPEKRGPMRKAFLGFLEKRHPSLFEKVSVLTGQLLADEIRATDGKDLNDLLNRIEDWIPKDAEEADAVYKALEEKMGPYMESVRQMARIKRRTRGIFIIS